MQGPGNFRLPNRIERLKKLAYNLWWTWNPAAGDLFRDVDPPLWDSCSHNPIKLLRETAPERLQALAADPTFQAAYDRVMAALDAYMSMPTDEEVWPASAYGNLPPGSIAYFSMEYAFHDFLPIYSGGLGVLAADYCKEASDLGLPLVGVGLMYSQGYFQQRLTEAGWQEEVYRDLNVEDMPITPVFSDNGGRVLVRVQLGDRLVSLGAWRVNVGRVNIYLLTTEVEGNSPQDRRILNRLYDAGRETRIEQEMLLGIGGVRMLRALDIQPSLWHANEGHASFMMVERLREELARGFPFSEALQRVATPTVFTTHTPVPAGTDVFSIPMVERYFSGFWESLQFDRQQFLNLGRQDEWRGETFNMTVLGLKTAAQRNAVSRLHGEVSRKLWRGLWPHLPETKVPISYVTNGVHVPTWVAPELVQLYTRYLGPDWRSRHADVALTEAVGSIPDAELWGVHMQLKRRAVSCIRKRAQRELADGLTAQQLVVRGAFLDPEVLTIGFARRVAEYKRHILIFHDVERLKRIVNGRTGPVQFVIAGKSHPADSPSKHLLQQLHRLAADRAFQGRIVFVEDYDLHVGRHLVQGVDAWLNTPRRLQEASGTSGMKAGLNGVVNLAVRDGWWHEAFNGSNGCAIGGDQGEVSPAKEDMEDAEALYRLLEETIVPLYYNRDGAGIPHGWMPMVKESISSIAPRFSSRRMINDYVQRMYAPVPSSGMKSLREG